MAVTANSDSSLHIEEFDFNQLLSNKMFYLVLFNCIKCPPTAKYTTEEFITK